MKRFLLKRFLLAIAILAPSLAFAHPGFDAGRHHASAFMMGLMHPFTGLDHMAAMVAVGVWSMQSFKNDRFAVWCAPVAFAGMLLVGGMLGFSGLKLLAVEPMIAVSLLVLGLFVALRVKLPLLLSVALVGIFAIFHGVAHGSELPAAQAMTVLSGMVTGTLLLHMSGMLLSYLLERNKWLPRMAGFSVAALGVSLLASAL